MSRSIEQSLNLVPVMKPQAANPVVQRRERLTKALNRQISLAQSYRSGEKTSRVWFWMNEDGQIFLQLKYGKKVLEISKRKYAIKCASIDEVEDNLELVKTLVAKGEFDNILAKASEEIRSAFKK